MTEFPDIKTNKNRREVKTETFYDIQDDATWAILRMFPIVLIVYSLSVGVLVAVAVAVCSFNVFYESNGIPMEMFFLSGCIIGAFLAVSHGLFCYFKSNDPLLDRIQADTLDDRDHFHNSFGNIVKEISIASPISNVEARVIPTSHSNALAVGDQDEAVVMLTEGALGRLRRDEIQAVVAHEIAHVAYGDSRLKQFTSSILETFDLVSFDDLDTSSSTTAGGHRYGGRALFAIIILTVVSAVLKALNRLMVTGISQEREWRADATAVEYSRNPEALASALYKMGFVETESGSVGLLSPAGSYADSASSQAYESLLFVPFESGKEVHKDLDWLGKLFSSHPPLFNRIEKCLDLAGVPYSELKSRIDEERQSSQVPVRSLRSDDDRPLRDLTWWIHSDGERQQIPLTQLISGELNSDDIMVAREGDQDWSSPDEHQELSKLREIYGSNNGEGQCPVCNVDFQRRFYLGAPIRACLLCGGVALGWKEIIRLQARHRDGDLPNHLGEVEDYSGYHGANPIAEDEKTDGMCPECGASFYAKRFRGTELIVDHCPKCNLVWFEEDELTIALNM